MADMASRIGEGSTSGACSDVPLSLVYEGWEGYNTSLVRAIEPRSADELAFRPRPDMRSVGEIAAHIGLGRIDWFHRMGTPEAALLAEEARAVTGPQGEALPALAGDAAQIVRWLEKSWEMIDATLQRWTVADLCVTYRQPYAGKVFAVSRQWTLFRMLAHDIQHGGQLSVLLGQQGIELVELGYLGGHITEPPLADPA